jgi:high-affinity Fe2+/Pb2+ permease
MIQDLIDTIGGGIVGLIEAAFNTIGGFLRGLVGEAQSLAPVPIIVIIGFVVLVVLAWNLARR